MTIEYALTRVEIVRYFLRSAARFPRLMVTLLLYTVIMDCIVLAGIGTFSHGLTVRAAATALALAALFLLLLPVTLFLRGKTSTRSMTVSSDGISTQIGSLQALVPWRKIKTVVAYDQYILIAGVSGNAFSIPGRAFSDPEHRVRFLAEIQQWRNQSTTN